MAYGKVNIKFDSLAWIRAILLDVFVAIPRLILAIILGNVGVLYLGLTANMGELLLNAMVGFDSYVDDLSSVEVWVRISKQAPVSLAASMLAKMLLELVPVTRGSGSDTRAKRQRIAGV